MRTRPGAAGRHGWQSALHFDTPLAQPLAEEKQRKNPLPGAYFLSAVGGEGGSDHSVVLERLRRHEFAQAFSRAVDPLYQ